MSPRTIRRCWPVAVTTVCTVVLLYCAARGWGGRDLLILLPALLLGSVLCARRYPGERLLLRYRRCRGPRAQSVLASSAAIPTDRRWMPRGGLLIAFALAVRPPPSACRAAS